MAGQQIRNCFWDEEVIRASVRMHDRHPQRPQLAPRAGAVSPPTQIQPERAWFWSRLGFSQDSLLQPEHRKMAIAPSGELTASMNVMGLLHAAHIGRGLLSRFAMRANAAQRNRFLFLFAVL